MAWIDIERHPVTTRARTLNRGVLAVVAAAVALAIAAASFLGFRWAVGTYDVPIDGYTASADGSKLVIMINTFQSAEIMTTSVDETRDRVTITVRARKDPQAFDFSTTRSIDVRLRRPLGDRPVVDGATGKSVSRS